MAMASEIVKKILLKRGVPESEHEAFLNPDYVATSHDPFLLPDMQVAVNRIVTAYDNNESVVIYGDYDVDGMTATTILRDALMAFGLRVETYTPDRFTEGYGLNMSAMRALAKTDASLVITVDCGSLSHEEIEVAGKLGLDVIITDHHAVAKDMPTAVAVINPHRPDSKYPFADLAGCGVAFKLVQALQTKLDGLPLGQEKWLLDFVALGTVCDIVPLLDENRAMVRWGLEVLRKTRRPGLRALMSVIDVLPTEVNARTIGYMIGPRLNAAGRISTAKSALELLTTDGNQRALELAQKLDSLNSARRTEQDKIFTVACEKLGQPKDSVIIVGDDGWNEGVIGIVASKIMEKYGKPTFVLSINGDKVKGSGRSFGDFNLAEAIAETKKYLEKGGGHAAAGGVTLVTDNIDSWTTALNEYYKKLNLKDQAKYLLPTEDVAEDSLSEINIDLINDLSKLEPFGMANEQPVFRLRNMTAKYVDRMGKKNEHLRLNLLDKEGNSMKLIAFSPPENWFIEPGSAVDIWAHLELNEWQGRQSVEGRILRLELS